MRSLQGVIFSWVRRLCNGMTELARKPWWMPYRIGHLLELQPSLATADVQNHVQELWDLAQRSWHRPKRKALSVFCN